MSDQVVSAASRYAGQKAVILTQHGKEAIVGPVLGEALGCRLERVEGFDTDTLGTFARDVPRVGTQLEAARRKARIGMELSGSRIGLGSEGSFTPDPYTGLMPWNLELLVWIDDTLGVEVVGAAQGPARSLHRSVRTVDELQRFAAEAGFPGHRLMLRPHDEDDLRIRKDLDDWPGLLEAFEWARRASPDGAVFVEHDLRAHCNPTRQQMIREAAHDLAARLGSACPACDAPGFWVSSVLRGRPCRACGAPTRLPVAEIRACVRCEQRQEQAVGGPPGAPPDRCDRCNP